MIKNETKRNIFDHFNMENIHFSGRMSEIDFLKRLYNLEVMPSHDSRYENALGDIWQHTQNNYDYEGNWVFDDSRFGLLNGTDEQFLTFICEMLHPLVRPDEKEIHKILSISNDWLKSDEFEIYPDRKIANGHIYKFKKLYGDPQLIPTEDDLITIWEPQKIRFFISHRDLHKSKAKELGNELGKYGLTCFVAHDSIQPMSTWKIEIMKGLQTMDACICFITSDFYESEWTNQEVGYALARGVPVYLYSSDKSDPKGFKLDIQAIKTGVPELLNCIKKDFSSNSKFKRIFIDELIAARDGSFAKSRAKFFDLIGLRFSNEEIEEILENITAKGGIAEPVNKLHAILQDGFDDSHKTHPLLRKYSNYRDYLEKEIINNHSTKTFSINQIESWSYELIENRKN